MTCVQANRHICLLALLLPLALGCGGSDDSKTDIPVPAAPTPPDMADGISPAGAGPATDQTTRVEFQTTAGNFTVLLHRERVPNTVDNFLKYVDAGYYNDTVFHQVIKGYAVVGGGYTFSGDAMLEKTAEGSTIHNEAENALTNKAGTIGMARQPEDADSACSQFYINLVDNAGLDFRPRSEKEPVWQTAGYCVFGQVEGDGLRVLQKIAESEVTSRNEMDNVPVNPCTITAIRRL